MTMKTSYAPNIARGMVSGEILLDIRDSCDADPQYMRSLIRRMREKLDLPPEALAEKSLECGISPKILQQLETGETIAESDLLQAQLLLANIYADSLLAETQMDADDADIAEAAAEAAPAEAAAEAEAEEEGASAEAAAGMSATEDESG